MIGNLIETKQIKQSEATVGESHKADRILEKRRWLLARRKRGEAAAETR